MNLQEFFIQKFKCISISFTVPSLTRFRFISVSQGKFLEYWFKFTSLSQYLLNALIRFITIGIIVTSLFSSNLINIITSLNTLLNVTFTLNEFRVILVVKNRFKSFISRANFLFVYMNVYILDTESSGVTSFFTESPKSQIYIAVLASSLHHSNSIFEFL